ncbi:hypothetical protein PS3A_28190 [Pseudomonas sp. 3A(2025)]
MTQASDEPAPPFRHPDLPDWVTAVLKDVVDANQHWLESEAKRLCRMDDRPVNQTLCN